MNLKHSAVHSSAELANLLAGLKAYRLNGFRGLIQTDTDTRQLVANYLVLTGEIQKAKDLYANGTQTRLPS